MAGAYKHAWKVRLETLRISKHCQNDKMARVATDRLISTWSWIYSCKKGK